MTHPSARTGLAEIGLLFVVAVWGFNFAIIKVPLEVIPPFAVNLLRFTVSLAVLTLIHLVQARLRNRSPWLEVKTFPVAVAVLGILAHVVYQTGFILGVDRVTAGGAALLIATSPIWTAVVGHLRGIDQMSTGGWVGLVMSLAGAALVVIGQAGSKIDGDGIGALLLIAAASAWGLTTVYSRPLLDRGASPLGLTVASLWVAYPLLALMGLSPLDETDWSQVGASEWLALLYSGGLSTGIAYWIWNVAVQRVGPSRTASFSNLVPFVGVAAGALLLRESIGPLKLAGGALIILGLVVMRRWR